MIKLIYIGLVCLITVSFSCTKDKYETELCADVSYSKCINPIIQTKCAVSGCHVSEFTPGDFTKYETLKQKVSAGKMQLMVFDLNNMPPVNKLSADETAMLKCWVEGGAVNN